MYKRQSQDAPSLLSADLEAYQNPFRQQVIDNTLGDLDRARQIQLQSDQDAAIGRGAFGGSRSALLESETNRNFADRAGDIASKLNLQGYDRATGLASQDIGREMQNRQFQAGLCGNQLAEQYQNFVLLAGIGNQQQMLNQAGNDFNFNEFLRQENDPYKRLAALTGTVSGIPVNQSTSSQKQTGLGDILGAGSQLAGMYFLGQSDERLKENIKLIGTSENGHNVYTWEWNNKAKELGVNNPTIGVIAQEDKKYMTEAVIKDDNDN